MARKLDHSKGGNYTPDPARVLTCNDFVEPDKLTLKGKRQRPLGIWAKAIVALKQVKDHKNQNILTQSELLKALGYKKMQPKRRGVLLKTLVKEGLLLSDGKPNHDNQKVAEIIRKSR